MRSEIAPPAGHVKRTFPSASVSRRSLGDDTSAFGSGRREAESTTWTRSVVGTGADRETAEERPTSNTREPNQWSVMGQSYGRLRQAAIRFHGWRATASRSCAFRTSTGGLRGSSVHLRNESSAESRSAEPSDSRRHLAVVLSR